MWKEIDRRKERGLWFRRTAPALAVALLFLASSVRDRVIPKLPATGGVDSFLPMSREDGDLFVEFGNVRFPLLTFEGDVCPLKIPDGAIIYCSRLALLDGGTKDVGAIYAGHNVHYTFPYNPDEWLQVTQDDPGGLAIMNQGKCVRFGRSWLKIGKFAVRNKNDAWWLD